MPAKLSLIDNVVPRVQRCVPAIRALELGTGSSDIRLRREKIIRYLFDLNSGVPRKRIGTSGKIAFQLAIPTLALPR